MIPLIDFILKYWIQELFALIIAVLTWLWRTLLRRKQENDEIDLQAAHKDRCVRGGDPRIPDAPSVNGAMLLLALRASKPVGLINLQEIEV